jgi:hypothetical protein
MIRMQVGEHYCADAIRINTKPADRNHCGSSTVDQEARIAMIGQEACIEATARTEGVTATAELHVHAPSLNSFW